MSGCRLWAAALLVSVALGCGGGGGGGGTPTTPPPPAPPPDPSGVFFTPGSGEAPAIVLAAESPQGVAGPFEVRVEADDVSGLFGVSFDLGFPDQRLSWSNGSFTEGDFLSESGDVDTEVLIERMPAGNLIVGISRVGDVGGVDGSGTILTLEFNVDSGTGTGELEFANSDAVDAQGFVITDVEFVSATLEVRR